MLLVTAALVKGQQAAAPAREGERDSIELYQALLDLQTPWTVMCVAAHPDDEDGATLTILRRKYGAHTVTVFSTYGEGGQNATGPELYEELGVIRARETEEAARIQGSEAYFLGLRDFGFSKSYEEAFRFWGHEEALRRMVLKIRELRPDVIITNHDTLSGHGHHQATGRLVLEAFDAAADPKRFPEQLRGGLSTWQARRLFVRFQFEGSGSKRAEEEALSAGAVVFINPNERDPVRGKTYAEQALEALQQHATQGPWPKTLPAGGRPVIRYRLARSARDAPPLPANPQTLLDGFSLPANFAERLVPGSVKALFSTYEAGQHSRQDILRTLVAARKAAFAAAGTNPGSRLDFDLMNRRLDRAFIVASGISATLAAKDDVLIPGTTTKFSLKISNNGERGARIWGINPRLLRQLSRFSFPKDLAPGETVTVELETRTPSKAAVSVPRAEHLYDGKLFGEEFDASFNVELDGASFSIEARTRINVVPAVEIVSITPSPLVLTPGTIKRDSTFNIRLANHRGTPFRGELTAGGPNINRVERSGDLILDFGSGNAVERFTLGPGETRDVRFKAAGAFKTMESTRSGKRPFPNLVSFTVTESSIPRALTKSRVHVVYSDAKVAPNLRVGYIRSYDDTLRDALAALGVEAQELKVEDVRAGDLSRYHSIIIDNRGYQAHPELISANARLLDYAQAGGTLIVFYHKTNEWNPDPKQNRPQLAPYPITLGNSRVTDELAPIVFTEKAHPLLNFPNKLTDDDFANWIQERGLYYPQTWDPRYSAPFSTNDPGEPPLRGGLLAAAYGRGRYIYTSMVWYRQLRAGVPGAYRMLANMISYGRKEN